jgi:hypothetical protein
LRIAEEQEIEITVELARLEAVGLGPVAVAADAIRIAGVFSELIEDGVAVEPAVDGVGSDDGRERRGAGREHAADDFRRSRQLHHLVGLGRGVPIHGALGLVGADEQDDAVDRCGSRGQHAGQLDGGGRDRDQTQ